MHASKHMTNAMQNHETRIYKIRFTQKWDIITTPRSCNSQFG